MNASTPSLAARASQDQGVSCANDEERSGAASAPSVSWCPGTSRSPRRCAHERGDTEGLARSARWIVERLKQLAQRHIEGSALRLAQRAEQAFLARDMDLEGGVRGPLPPPGQPDEGGTAVARIRAPLDQPRVDETVDPLRHPARREQGRRHQLGRVKLVRRSRPAQRGDQVEPTVVEAARAQGPGQLGAGELRLAEEASKEGERCDVEVRPLASPLLDADVDAVALANSHARKIASWQDTFRTA